MATKKTGVTKKASATLKAPSAPENKNEEPAADLTVKVETDTDTVMASEAVPAFSNIDDAISLLLSEGYQIVKQDETTILDTRAVVVIPYKKDSAAGEELRFAVRAWEKNLAGCKIVVIGDREDWFSTDLLHIPMEVMSNNPQIDVAHKMMVAIASDEIPENFIWSNDDILPISPIDLADIQLLKSNGKLRTNKPELNGTYAQNKQRTIEFLGKVGLNAWDYSTHTPFFFNKQKLASILLDIKADEEGYLISSVYFNLFYPSITPVQITGDANCFFTAYVYRENPPADLVEKVFATRKFINYNDKGYKAIAKYIESKFPDESEFEV